MADISDCLGHGERNARQNKITKLLSAPQQNPDENLRLLIKKGPVSEETSLKELEENYAWKPEWKVIEEGGLLCVPVEEFRMINPPKPDRAGNIKFGEKKGRGAKQQIDSYSLAETVQDLNDIVRTKYDEVHEKSKAGGKSEAVSQREATTEALKLPQYQAVQKWLDLQK